MPDSNNKTGTAKILAPLEMLGAGIVRAWELSRQYLEDQQLQKCQAHIKACITRAEPHQDEPEIADILVSIPDTWEEMALPETKALERRVCVKLDALSEQAAQAIASAEKEAEAQAVRTKRCAEILSLMNDESSVAEFNAGEVLKKEHLENFRRVLKSSGPRGKGVVDQIDDAELQATAANNYPKNISFSCAVGQIPETQRQLLRIGAVLLKHDIIDPEWIELALAGAIFEFGKARVSQRPDSTSRAQKIALNTLIESLPVYLVDSGQLQEDIAHLSNQLQTKHPNTPAAQELANLAGGGAAWLTGADIPKSIYNPAMGDGLFLGALEDGTFLNYDGEGSLFTIAPPGAGKSRCQVIPNLLTYSGPAIVLDIKGECYSDTAGFRSQRYGKVIRFAPHDKENSARYNPLDFVRNDPEHLASDARKMADMLIVSNNAKDPYWDNKGRDFLTAYIAFIALLSEGDKERNMASVMDMMSPTADMLENAIEALRDTGIKFLERMANQMETIPQKQRESAMDVARTHLSAWDLGDLDALTTHCDWKPEEFRNQDNPPTLYLCIQPEDIGRFASVIRVIIGQHLEHFLKELPEDVEKPIVFFLDEAPQLGNFEPLPKAASLGRQYGLQLWLFAQNRDQIEKAYQNAETILGNAVVQCWMNCDEDAAANLERNLGRSRGLLDGMEKPLVQSHEIRGPEYNDKIILVGRGQKPARLQKHMVFNDETLSPLLGLDVLATEDIVHVEESSYSADEHKPVDAGDVSSPEQADTSQPN
ncbi:type IV secretory system conjugative DNA transfer family protein [Parvibaculaceae bacterium PLY_AMNH_Bact1]|nr:type IV secretory system conjugative DNA transfer family protein [Parvibaculaceae bacterium PLY_AMNH_Bact1]